MIESGNIASAYILRVHESSGLYAIYIPADSHISTDGGISLRYGGLELTAKACCKHKKKRGTD